VLCEAFPSITGIRAMKRPPHAGLSKRSSNICMAFSAKGGIYIFSLGLRVDGSRTRAIRQVQDRNAHTGNPKQRHGNSAPLRFELPHPHTGFR